MIAAVVAQGLVIALLVYVLLRREEHRDTLIDTLMVRAEHERAVLADRIQRPDVLPRPIREASGAPHHPPRDIANLAKIGTITRGVPDEVA